jgi:hypothetical protein
VTSGFRTFTAGEVLTASNVQNYLMDQSVMTFAGSAARSSAIGTANFEEGMTSYLKDTDKLEVYNGTNWVGVAPTTTQGLTLINTTSFSGVASQSVNDVFSATYKNYKIFYSGNGTSDNAFNIRMRVSGTDNSTSNYYYSGYFVESSSAAITLAKGDPTTSFRIGITSSDTDIILVELSAPFTSDKTSYVAHCGYGLGTNEGGQSTQGGFFSGTTSFTGFTLIPASGNITGEVSVYGYNK